jgi:hypothetical protein
MDKNSSRNGGYFFIDCFCLYNDWLLSNSARTDSFTLL